jgi:hypothetical protein
MIARGHGAEPTATARDDAGVSGLRRRTFLGGAVAGIGLLGIGAHPLARGAFAAPPRVTVEDFDAAVATAWFDRSLDLVRQTAGFSPPVASRAYAYLGLALYEALVPGMGGYRSLAGLRTELDPVPQAGRSTAYHWPSVANAALAAIARDLFVSAPPRLRESIVHLEETLDARLARGVAPGIRRRSVERGREVAVAVFGWSKGDGGHEGELRSVDPGYTPPEGPGLWVPTPPGFLPALQPHWGDNRPFVVEVRTCPAGAHTTYSTEPGSPFRREAVEVYDAVDELTDEQLAIARFWADDPGSTATPPGHSIAILTRTLQDVNATLGVAAEAYARVGMAIADAFISCWRVKYATNLLRPVTYLRELIEPRWEPPVVTPPFPEHPSGHSVQSGAAAAVLTDMFGQHAFVDHTHDRLGLAPRSFTSFDAAAAEAAISRLYGGIHFRPAIELGLEQGECIGRSVSALRLRS